MPRPFLCYSRDMRQTEADEAYEQKARWMARHAEKGTRKAARTGSTRTGYVATCIEMDHAEALELNRRDER